MPELKTLSDKRYDKTLAISTTVSTSSAVSPQQAACQQTEKHSQNGLGLMLMGGLHTLYCLIIAPVNGLELSLLLSNPLFSDTSRFAVLLGFSLFGLPLILLGLCLHSLEQSPARHQQAVLPLLAAGLALLSVAALIVQPYSVFWLGLLLAGRMLSGR